MNTEQKAHALNVPSALMAGAVATVVITVAMALFGMDIMKGIGMMMLGPDAGAAAQYAVGGLVHFMIGLMYAMTFAIFASKLTFISMPALGLIFGAIITPIAIFGMPVMASMFGGGSAGNPCAANPCAPAMNPCGDAMNPCNPCAAANPCAPAMNPCNPCAAANPCAPAMNPCGDAMNPCNPCAAANPCATAMNPCNPCAAANPCALAMNPCGDAVNPCNPCAATNPCAAGNPCNPCGGQDANALLTSLINHLIYGLVLGLMYRPKEA